MEEIKKIPSRDQIPAEDKWAIEDLYPTDEAWEAELAALAASQKTLASFAGRLGESGETLYAYMEVFEQVNAKGDLLGSYCMRRADEDTRNATYQAMAGKFMGVAVALNAACSFDTPEIMAISDEKLAQFYADCPKLERYRRYLTNLRRRKAHTLSAAEEKLRELHETAIAWKRCENAFGITSRRAPSKNESQFAHRWVFEWRMPDELLNEAITAVWITPARST